MRGRFASVHVVDFRSPAAAAAWRRRVRRSAAALPGLVWIRAMTGLGAASSAGLSAGAPAPGRQLVVAAWASRDVFERACGAAEPPWPVTSRDAGMGAAEPPWPVASRDAGMGAAEPPWPVASRDAGMGAAEPPWPVASRDAGMGAAEPPWAPRGACRHAWEALLTPYRARGTHRGPVPFTAAAAAAAVDGPVAVLTLGRTSWRTALPFTVAGSRLAGTVAQAPGLVTALSAGFPPAGNATFTVWEREADMLRFAFDRRSAHRAVAARGLLVEQIAVRFRVEAIRGTWDPAATIRPGALAALAARHDG